nr:phosphatidate cytidylyltransferase [Chitinophagaceae bacterium]
MALNVKVFFTRLGSAAIFSAIMLWAFLSKEWAFAGLFFIINILCLREYAFIVERILEVSFSRNEKMNFYIMGVAVFLLICALPLNTCETLFTVYVSQFVFYFLGILIGACITFLFFLKNKKAYYLLTGIGYISLALGLLVQLRYQSLLLPLILMLLIWMNDTMAYLTGSFIGKTKFIPSISPNKTLEGLLGGFFFTFLFAFIWGYFTHWFPIAHWMVFALIAGLVGTAGDLVESKLKRMAEIKDSGSLMPGHGGALDRFDSLLLTAPVAFLFALIFMKCFPYVVF